MSQTNGQTGRVLQDLTQFSQAQLVQMLLDAHAKLEAQPARRVSFKVTDKGGCSAYGLGRFPVTLYKSQWLQLITAMPELEAFLRANASKLTTRPE
jgi:hypothetical protein